MRFLLAIFLLLSPPCIARDVIVISDSTTSEAGGWADLLRDNHGHHVSINAQGGRFGSLYHAPPDLQAGLPFDVVVWSLGANDLTAEQQGGYVPLTFAGITRYLNNWMSVTNWLRGRGFKVLSVIPPRYVTLEAEADQLRLLMTNYCAFFNLKCWDMNSVWNDSWTVDGDHIHPDPNTPLPGNIAAAISNELAAL